jgi:AcrR family transcriptional regulator
MAVAARRNPLRPDLVLAAAVTVADAEGIDAVTLRRLADELGVHPTSIYNHVPSKEAILDGMTETLFAEAGLGTAFADWRDWIRSFAAGIRGIARTHPGAFMVFTRRAAEGPYASAHTEAALDAFHRGGFAPADAAEIMTGVSLAVLGLALNECPPVGPSVAPDLTHLSVERFPRIFEAAAARTGRDEDAMWDRLVEALIAGLAETSLTADA